MQLGMAKTTKTPTIGLGSRPRRPNPPLYIGQWIRRLGLKQVDVARGARIGESYMSSIIKGDKYPRPGILEDIAGAMGLTVEALKKPPPDDHAIRATAGLDAETLARLLETTRKN